MRTGRSVLLRLVGLAALVAGGACGDADRLAHKSLALKIAHLNDTHSQLEPLSLSLTFKDSSGKDEKVKALVGGLPRLIAKLKALRAASQPLLVLHAGDAVQGTLYFTKYLGQADVALLNLLAPDAMTLGNHEFDKGPQPLADFIKQARFPVLGGNLDASQDASLKDLIRPYSVHELDGEKVAVIGMTTPDTAATSSPGATVSFREVKASVEKRVKEVEGQGINKIVLLTHQGHDEDLALAKTIEGVDVIVGGHSHTLLGDLAALGIQTKGSYPRQVSTPAGRSVCVVQAWERTKALGLLDVTLDRDGFVTSCGGKATILLGTSFTQYDPTTKKDEEVPAAKQAELLEQIAATGGAYEVVADDPAALATLDTDFRPGIDALRKLEIAEVIEDLWNLRIPGTPHPTAGVLPKGSLITPHLAESLLWKTRQLSSAAELAIVNAGAAWIDIPRGKLTVAQVYTLQPFGNTLFLLQLTGAEVKAQLEQALGTAIVSGSTGAFPYVAGIRYTADLTKGAGQQITVLEIDPGGGSWSAIEPSRLYRVATNQFIAAGGDGYRIFKDATTYRVDTGFVDAEVFNDYAAARQQLARLPDSTGVTLLR